MNKSGLESPPVSTASAATLPLSGLPPGATYDPHRRFLATDHLLANLKGRTISSGMVTALSQGIQFALTLTSTMVLARLLMPEDFGVVAMVATVMGFLRVFSDAGLSTATVQREGITHAQVSNLFWANVAIGGAVSLVLAAASPLVAWFFREPQLVGVTLALCLTFLVTSSAVQHLALLKRQMRFHVVAGIEVGALALGISVGIGLAYFQFGYWSLVGMQLTTTFAAFAFTWCASLWRPQWPTRGVGTRPLLNFGANLTMSSFLWSLARGMDGVLIGRFFGSASLGLYSRAAALVARPVQQAMAPIEAVFVPLLSRLQNEPIRYRQAVLQAHEAIAVGSFLLTGLLLGLAHPLTLVVLGKKWEAAAPILAAFSLVALSTPVGSVASWLLTSQGRGRDFLLMSIIASSSTVAALLIGIPFGPYAVALSYSACSLLVGLPVAYHIAGRRGPVKSRDLWLRFFKHLPLWAVVCGVTYWTRLGTEGLVPLIQLTVCAMAGLFSGGIFILAYGPSRRTALSVIVALRDWRSLRKLHKTVPA